MWRWSVEMAWSWGKKASYLSLCVRMSWSFKEPRISSIPRALGENFTTRGLDYHLLRLGDIFRVGADVVICLTNIRAPCGTIRKAYSPHAEKGQGIEAAMWDKEVKKGKIAAEKWGMTGFYAEVLREGIVAKGDSIEKILSGAITESWEARERVF